MRALTISGHGDLDRLELRDDLPVPEVVRDTDVRVRVHAGALNHLDLFVVGGLPSVTITPPWIMGGDGAGIVEAVGSAVRTVSVGDHVTINAGISDRTCEYCQAGEQSLCIKFRLLGEHLPGTFAEYVVVPSTNVRAIPPTTSWPDAAAFTLATLTAYRMIVTRANVQPGEHVLIWGIGGGVSLASMRLAKRLGAHVWVTSSSEAKLARARQLGADELLNHRTTDVGREVRARSGKRGVDVVIDNVGESTWQGSLTALGRAGRLVTCGATSGPHVSVDARRLFWNQWTIMGSTMGNDAEYDAVTELLRAGDLLPVVDTVYPIEESRQAFERMRQAEQFGKIVIEIAR
jgi:NADPH:quinone reductase-like Zn-dependent oxidoreductase